ncbi:uroporphyrinogen-III C-methyltransferase, partial [Mycobacterium sp. E2238]
MTTRGRKPRPGRITYVGSGPGDPGLLTTRAATVLANAALVFTDPDVPEPVLALIGKDLPPVSGPAPAEAPAGGGDAATGPEQPAVISAGPDVRPALGEPAEVAKTLTAEARTGADVVRLVAGDPLTVDAVITEVNAVARSHLHIEIVPGLAPTDSVPTYAGLPLGSSHTVADVRDPHVDWDALAAAPGPLILQATTSHLADAARTLIEHELAETTPCVVTAHGTTCQQRSIETTLGGLTDSAVLGATDPAGPLTGPLVVTIGKTVASRAKLNWWESRALYGWTVLVPRTKDQAGEMSERLTSYGALPIEVPTIAVEPPRSPAQMERAVKGL